MWTKKPRKRVRRILRAEESIKRVRRVFTGRGKMKTRAVDLFQPKEETTLHRHFRCYALFSLSFTRNRVCFEYCYTFAILGTLRSKWFFEISFSCDCWKFWWNSFCKRVCEGNFFLKIHYLSEPHLVYRQPPHNEKQATTWITKTSAKAPSPFDCFII